MKVFNGRQFSILSERYFECLLGDASSFVWMIGQAPIIAFLIILRWKSYQATDTLYFVMVLSVIWFGCINACREIARERSIVKREQLYGLNMPAYLFSKVKVLSIVGLIEITLFYFILRYNLSLNVSGALAYIALFFMYFSGMSLGLLLSEFCGSVSKAVISVPVAILPQIVFSQFVLPSSTLKGVAKTIEKLMVAKWGFKAMSASVKGNIVFGEYSSSLLVLTGLGVLFLLLTLVHLSLSSR